MANRKLGLGGIGGIGGNMVSTGKVIEGAVAAGAGVVPSAGAGGAVGVAGTAGTFAVVAGRVGIVGAAGTITGAIVVGGVI